MYVMVRSFLLLYSVADYFLISFKGYFIICGKEVVTPRLHFYNPLSFVFRRKQFVQNKKTPAVSIDQDNRERDLTF